jgi:hypothetical protein
MRCVEKKLVITIFSFSGKTFSLKLPSITSVPVSFKTGENQMRDTDSTLREVRKQADDINDQDLPALARRIRAGLQGIERLPINEATVPDLFQTMPKLISPRVHAWLDFAVTTYFAGVGAWCLRRGNKRAATAAFVNAAMVASVSLLTDYDGDGNRPINFKLHGTLDAVQAATAALGPVLHGFAGEAEAAFFYGQAANEVAVIASTDWDAGMPFEEQLLAA